MGEEAKDTVLPSVFWSQVLFQKDACLFKLRNPASFTQKKKAIQICWEIFFKMGKKIYNEPVPQPEKWSETKISSFDNHLALLSTTFSSRKTNFLFAKFFFNFALFFFLNNINLDTDLFLIFYQDQMRPSDSLRLLFQYTSSNFHN